MMNLNNEEKITFTHIHGLGYTSNGEEIYVPSHDGLIVFKDGHWFVPENNEKHDYMGFSMYKDGFYSSGHPHPNSKLINPLGIVRSTDQGKSLEMIDLYGEVDFHGMTVGYETEDIYVFNPSPNSRMNQPGLYYSTDQTESWHQSKMNGVVGQARAISAHPTKEGVVAVGTDQGAFLSEDYGSTFEKLNITGLVSAVSFDYNNNLLLSTQSNHVNLIQINLSSNEINEINIPNIEDDSILYIQQNPTNYKEIAFATARKDIYISYDRGNKWEKSVDQGVAISH